jgi:hypothetical protein
MKKNLLLGCLGLLGVVAAGAGAVVISEKKAARADASTTGDETITLSEGAYASSIITWTGTHATVTQNKGLSSTAVNSSYVSAPRIYSGQYLQFTTKADVTFNSITIVATGTYIGSNLYCGASTTSIAPDATVNTSAPTNNNISVTAASTLTISLSTVSGCTSVYLQNDLGSKSGSYTQLRISSISFNYTSTAAVVAPTSISFGTYSTSMVAGTSQDITATMLPATTTESVVWTISDASVADLKNTATVGGISTATISPLNNGTFTLTATADTTTSITATTSVITVTGFNVDLSPKTISASSLSLSSSNYASNDGTKFLNDIGYGCKNVMLVAGDYTPGSKYASDGSTYTSYGSTTFEKGAIQMQKSTGFLWNRTKFGAQISDVLICGIADTNSLVVNGGATEQASTSTTTVTNDGRFFKYTFSTPVDYAVISCTNTGYFNCVTFELSGGAETVSSFADYLLGIQPDRSDDISLCLGTNGNYVMAKNRYIDAPVTVRQAFQDSTDATVVSARTRYVQWATVYGDSTPFALTYGTAAHSFLADSNSDTTFMAVLVSFVVVGGFAAFMMIRRKKQA